MNTIRGIAFTLWLFALLLLTTNGHAQTLSEGELAKLPPEVASQLKNIPIKDILNGKAAIRSNLPDATARDPDWVSPLPITLHLRGTQGTELPTKAALINNRKKARAQKPVDTTPAQEFFQKQSNEFVEKLSNVPKLPECFRDKRTFEQYPKQSSDNLLQDILFIDPEQIPMESEDAFGKIVTVVAYSEKSPNSWAHYATLENIKCLPSRIRIFGSGVDRLEGLPALKNFSADLHGEGQLSDVMKAKVRRFSYQSGGQ